MSTYLCPVCNSHQQAIAFHATPLDYSTDTSFEIIQCKSCKHGYTFGVIYDSASYESGSYDLKEKFWHKALNPLFNYLEKNKTDYINDHLKAPGNILEIGAGKGRFVRALRKKEYNAFGIEPSQRSFNLSKNSASGFVYNCMLDQITKIPELNTKFSFIVLWHVLEHIENPKLILNEIRDHLTENGFVLIGVPNFDSWQAHIGKSDWYHLDPSRHISHFTPQSLSTLAESCQYKVEKIYFNSFYQDFMGELITAVNTLCPAKNSVLNTIRLNKKYIQNIGKALSIFWFLYSSALSLLLAPFIILSTIASSFYKKSGTMVFVIRKT